MGLKVHVERYAHCLKVSRYARVLIQNPGSLSKQIILEVSEKALDS